MTIKHLLPLLLLIAFSCKKPAETTAMQITDMPLRVGDSWSYLVTNYPPTETDTATITITGTETPFIPGSVLYNTRTTIQGQAVDSGLISVTSTSIAYTGYNGHQTYAGSDVFNNWNFSFPIHNNSTWGSGGESVQVISTGQNVTLAGMPYINVTTLVRTSTTPGGIVTDTVLLAPRIGIIEWDGFPIVGYKL